MTDLNQAVQVRTGVKSLKDQNRWLLWVILAVNSFFLYGVVQSNTIKVYGVRAMFANVNSLIPVGFALVIATVLNGLLSDESKARLVFLRWRDALPGHRAFSKHGRCDPRIDLVALKKLHGSEFPTNPTDQNRTWYRMYKTVESEPAVRQVHRDFLLLRDYTGLSALFVVFYGTAGLYEIRSAKVSLLYFALLILQYIVVRHAAANYGTGFVKTVLAQKAASAKE